MNLGVITGVFSCTKIRIEKFEVRNKNKETRIKTWKIWKTEVKKIQDLKFKILTSKRKFKKIKVKSLVSEVKKIRLKKITFGKITTFVNLSAGKDRCMAKNSLAVHWRSKSEK